MITCWVFSCRNSSQWAATPYKKQLFNISCYPSWCSCTEPSLSHLFPLSDIPLPVSRQWKFQVPEMATTTLTLVKVNPQRENFQGSLTTVESTFHTIPEHLPNLSLLTIPNLILLTTPGFICSSDAEFSFEIIISISHAIFLSYVNHECILTCSPFNLWSTCTSFPSIL